jgi:tRNA(Ile)-lysidine synthase TilS/MesJ
VDEDWNTVKTYAAQLGIVDVRKVRYMDANHTEAAMRRWRRDELYHIANEKDNSCIVTGHHLDDRIETALLRLWKGTGMI